LVWSPVLHPQSFLSYVTIHFFSLILYHKFGQASTNNI